MEKYNGSFTLLNIKYFEFKFINFNCIINIEAICAKVRCDALDHFILHVTKLINF